jgi:serine/threonine protein kinase
MAPEQARGKAADKRSDIWSFGVILYEMLTGKRLFQGESTVEILGAVLNKESDISAAPPRVHKLLRWCLEKDRKQRLACISDARRMLGRDSAAGVESAAAIAPLAARSGKLPWLVAALLAIFAAVALSSPWRKPSAPPGVVKFEIFSPEKTAIGKFAVSPDGHKIAFYAESSGRGGLWVRSLDSVEWQLVANVPASGIPTFFWSYDSRFLAFPGATATTN